MAEQAVDAARLGSLKSPALNVAGRRLVWGTRTYVMGILNITSDSFSGDGLMAEGAGAKETIEVALSTARRFVEAGVDILDVGGESTRPGSLPLKAAQEMERVVPVVEKLASELDALISVDTYKASVARAALQAGAHMLNDVWGLRADSELGQVAARFDVPLILMHNRSSWAHAEIKEGLGGRYIGMAYNNLLEDICDDLRGSVALAVEAGVSTGKIILDPGIGFGKTVEQNLELIDRLDQIRLLGYPILLGPSRKSFIGYTLDLPAAQRLEGTAAAVAVGIARGADIVRVHDIPEILRVVRMTDAIVRRNT
jgi:dihydropteroate synthase